jgi:hypothetical protein
VKAATILALLLVSAAPAFAQLDSPSVDDPELVVERFVSGIAGPTSIAFVGDDLLCCKRPTARCAWYGAG